MKRIAIAIVASLALLAGCSEQTPTAADKAAEAARPPGSCKDRDRGRQEGRRKAVDSVKQRPTAPRKRRPMRPSAPKRS